MHELSVAENIVEIIHQYVPAAERPLVRRVFALVGQQSGIVADSLVFGFQAITAGTDLERSTLEIDSVPFVIQCHECGKESSPELGGRICLHCQSLNTSVLSGTELRIREIETDDEEH